MARRMLARRMLAGVLALAALSLGGCVLTSPVVLTAVPLADLATLNATDKTLVDHVASAATGEDCSLMSWTETGDYCPERVVVDRSNLYCYRTLADVDCHYLPDPYRNGHVALASPPPVRTPVEEKGWFD